MQMFAVGWRSISDKEHPLPENGKTTWAIFSNKINAQQWSDQHGGKCEIRPVEVSLKFEPRLTSRAPDVAYECPKCGDTLEKDGWCNQHGLPAQPRR